MATKAATKFIRPDATGRTKGAQARHIRMYYHELSSEAWRSLNCVERCLYWLLLEIFNGHNNGKIALSVRDAAKALKVDIKTARKAFDGLIARGFIKVAKDSSFKCKQGKAREFELTVFERDGKKASKDFMRWQIQKTVGARPTDGRSTSHCEGSKEASTSAHGGSTSHCESQESPPHGGSTSHTSSIPGEGVSAFPKRASERPDLVGENPPRHHAEPELLGVITNEAKVAEDQRKEAERVWKPKVLEKFGENIFTDLPRDIEEQATGAELAKFGGGTKFIEEWWAEDAKKELAA